MKKVKYETNIDTVAIQLNFSTGKEQRNKFNLIYNWIIGRRLGKLKNSKDKSNYKVNAYDLMSGNSKLATLHTGFSKNFYIRIRWCGLKSFKSKQDEKSIVSLMTICAFLNTTMSNYRFVELDITLDLFCPLNRVLVACINKVNNVQYNDIGFLQYYDGVPTNYVEDYKDKKKRTYAMKRSYLYDKSKKENLNYFVTRFEIKLQNRYFLRYGFNFDSIVSALNKYTVLHFSNSLDKEYMLRSLKYKRSLALFQLEQNQIKIFHDLDVIADFIDQVKNTYVDFYGNIAIK